MAGALDGLLVVSVEQAVAAPYCSSRLADAGARVIKIERPEGDFARGYDKAMSWPVELFRLAEPRQAIPHRSTSRRKDDLALLHRILIGKADVLIQNLAPGAAERAGFGSAAHAGRAQEADHRRRLGLWRSRAVQEPPRLRPAGPGRERPRLDHRRPSTRRAGSASRPADIGTGMYAHAAVLEALIAPRPHRRGGAISVSLFSSMAEWMTVPLLAMEYSNLRMAAASASPIRSSRPTASIRRLGQGAGADLDPERPRVRAAVPRRASTGRAWRRIPDYATGKARNARRDETNAIVAKSFASQTFADLSARLEAAQIAWARVSSVKDSDDPPAAPPHRLQLDRRQATSRSRRWPPPTPASPSGWATCRRSASTATQIRREFAA
jgi:itaconate CoA-transferase